MAWIKHVLLDLVVTLAIVAYALGARPEWLWWAIAVYSGLMLLLKIVAVSSPTVTGLSNRAASAVPAWFFHAAYAMSVTALLHARWYEAAAAWAAMWLLSFAADARAKRPTAVPAVRSSKGRTAPANG